MAFDQVKSGRVDGSKERTRVAADLRQAVAIINVSRADLPAYQFAQWFRLLVMRLYADAMLRRTLRPKPAVRRTPVDELSPYIRRDIGWPPE